METKEKKSRDLDAPYAQSYVLLLHTPLVNPPSAPSAALAWPPLFPFPFPFSFPFPFPFPRVSLFYILKFFFWNFMSLLILGSSWVRVEIGKKIEKRIVRVVLSTDLIQFGSLRMY